MSWLPASLIVLTVALAAGFAWYEREHPTARVLALVGALAALAVVGRIAFAAVPNVKPTTDIVLFAGFALGGAPGFAVGALAALVSNFFFGQGPWTPWQMAAWGGVGVFGALLAKMSRGRELGRVPLALACAVAGVFFGMVMDAFQWTLGEPHTLGAYAAVSARSLGFNIAHVVGNVVFCLLIGPAFVRALKRYRRRFEFRWPKPAPAPVVAAVVLALVLAPLPSAAHAASPAARAVDYLKSAQNGDGGFGGARGQGSTQLHSGWVALGLAAAGQNPRSVQRGGNSAVDYIRGGAGSLKDTGELERTILVLRASGLSASDFAGRNLLAELQGRRRSNGSFGTINWTAFGVLALGNPRKSVAYLVKNQNGDGGFGFSTAASSDADDTGTVLQALAAGGQRDSKAARRAIAYLRKTQHPDGGWGQMPSQPSNAQSTAWAVQGLVAAGRNPAKVKRGSRSPLDYLLALQRKDGSFRYSRTSVQTPVWVTAQALVAIERKAFPLEAVPLAARSGGGGGGAAGSGGQRQPGGDRKRRTTETSPAEPDTTAPATPAPGGDATAGGAAAPTATTPAALGNPASQPVAGRRDHSNGDMGRAIAIAAAAAVVLAGVGWWRYRRREDPLAG
jgi:energy-coupling factor transport system substrate-specific component